MNLRTETALPIVATAFVPWFIKITLLFKITEFPRSLLVAAHWLMVVLFFGVTFSWYFQRHPKAEPFIVTIIAMVSLAVFEYIYFSYFYTGDLWFLTYADWIVPAFLIASTIYFVGKLTSGR
jgi:hypothetical protein